MSPSESFDNAFKRAVTPGSDRLLAGVALAAAARSQKGKVLPCIFVFHVLKRSRRSTEKKETSGDRVNWTSG
jgi:hypothetical protein